MLQGKAITIPGIDYKSEVACIDVILPWYKNFTSEQLFGEVKPATNFILFKTVKTLKTNIYTEIQATKLKTGTGRKSQLCREEYKCM